MNQPFLIGGPGFEPNPIPGRASQPHSGRLIKVVVVVWLLGGAGYLTWRLALPHTDAAPPPTQAATIAPTAISNEDLAHHVEAINNRITEATARLRQAEDLLRRTIPSVERNYLFLEKQRLQSAQAATEAARRNLEQSRQDADLVLNSLKEHQLK